ncbi:bifunctional ADP-dependent NAD(P)H-hydrate dehydratase/NAD(P)H-hydrate epimerase [Asaia astilbis]|uniref:bifunctional ADP-dependent NAD(P)H-hydrate dehydratase/NAD(P)H-hydrate epimerase n=1 Tax=Asaia astilbis TaxID=610244 RepID=UPI00047082E9|nr:bifunctional ADP-dependent NAD(P)H-hydrate dehydratase/NAD(P)H-hydrate epimerase [Asaia astilbis]
MKPELQFALLTAAQCAVMDRKASETIGIAGLMDRAGWAVAQAVRARFTPRRVLVLCGPGNNGGDGYVAARYLERAGWPVQVAALSPPREGSAAGEASRQFRGLRTGFSAQNAARADLVIDAVFGAGLDRPPSEEVMSVLRAAKALVAIDLPSGVDGTTGALLADGPDYRMSVTFVRPKPGHVLYPARAKCGETICADIGMPEECVSHAAPDIWLNVPGLWRIPAMTPQDHKYTRGVVSLCAGRVMPGATRLAAAGARASGAGLVRINAGEGADSYRLGAPGLVVDDASLVSLLEDKRRAVWLCGPGLTPEEVDACLPLLLAADKIVLADASALGWAGNEPERLRGVSVITPHIGEFTRLFGPPDDDSVSAARRAAAELGAVVVLKGAVSVIAAPDGHVALNDHASPALATAGSGDTLAGVIGTMLAAGMPPWEAACAGVWVHGEAGLQAGHWPIAEALDAHLGDARAKAIELACGTGELAVKRRA